MRTGTFYLNNHGSKWVVLPKEKHMKARVIHRAANYDKIRTIDYFESFGNFGAAVVRYKGKKHSILPEGPDKDGNILLYIDYHEKGETL